MKKIIKGHNIPYMGNKKGIVQPLLQAIIGSVDNPTERNFIDAFGGGGIVSTTANINNLFKTVTYNEFNKYVYTLFTFLQKNSIPKEWYKWVSKEKYEHIRANRHLYKPEYVGMVMQCYTFANNQQDYLYGKKTEEIKRLTHEIVVNKDKSAMKSLNIVLPEEFYLEEDLRKRRLYLREIRLQHLEHLNNVEDLEKLTLKPNFSTSNLSYEALNTSEGDIVYCDPPYENTKQYQIKFNHSKFEKWLKEQTDKNITVFVSEYDLKVENYTPLIEIPKRQLISTSKRKISIEKLYWNGVK